MVYYLELKDLILMKLKLMLNSCVMFSLFVMEINEISILIIFNGKGNGYGVGMS